MGNPRWFASRMKTVHVFLDALIFPGNPCMLAQMAEPGILLINFGIAAGQGNILENSPAECAVAATNGSPRTASRLATMPERTSPVPAVASHAGAGGAKPRRPSGAATSVSGPL